MMNAEQDISQYKNMKASDFEYLQNTDIRDYVFDKSHVRDPKNVCFKGNLYLHKKGLVHNFKFQNCVFDGNLKVEVVDSILIEFIECEFLGDVKIKSPTKNSFQIVNCKAHKTINIGTGEYDQFYIHSKLDFKNSINVDGGTFGTLRIGGISESFGNYSKIDISCNNVKGTLAFEHAKISNINIGGIISKDASLLVYQCIISEFKVFHFSNYGVFRLINLNATKNANNYSFGKFEITFSNLGKAEFFNIDFRRYKSFCLLRNNITEGVFVDVMWPTRDFELAADDHSADLRETYRQLKHVYSKQGDSISEYYFHAREMRMALKSSWLQFLGRKIAKQNSTRSGFQNFQDLFVLGFSWCGSNFGLSWFLPLVVLLSVNSILIAIGAFNDAIPGIEASFGNLAKPSVILDTFPQLIYYSNPFRKLNENLTGSGIILDMLIRTISSYGLYNFVRATRRFVK